MSSSISSAVGGVTVVTHVHPSNSASGQPQQHVGIAAFTKCWPQALGTVQIMVGVMILLFGIASTPRADSVGVFSGIFVWGAAFYIAAGSLTVVAGKRLTRCLVNSALGVGVVAAVAGGVGVILYSLDSSIIIGCHYHDYDGDCYLYESRTKGVAGVLAVFNMLEMIVSIVVAGYACHSTCSCRDSPTVVVLQRGALTNDESVALHSENIKGAEETASMSRPPPYSPA